MSKNKDKLLHYGVKGMKWDKEKVEEDIEVKKKKLNQKSSEFADKILKSLKINTKTSTKSVTVSENKVTGPSDKQVKSKFKEILDKDKPKNYKNKDGTLNGNAKIKPTIKGVMKDGKRITNLDRAVNAIKDKVKPKTDGSAKIKPTIKGVMKDGKRITNLDRAVNAIKNKVKPKTDGSAKIKPDFENAKRLREKDKKTNTLPKPTTKKELADGIMRALEKNNEKKSSTKLKKKVKRKVNQANRYVDNILKRTGVKSTSRPRSSNNRSR